MPTGRGRRAHILRERRLAQAGPRADGVRTSGPPVKGRVLFPAPRARLTLLDRPPAADHIVAATTAHDVSRSRRVRFGSKGLTDHVLAQVVTVVVRPSQVRSHISGGPGGFTQQTSFVNPLHKITLWTGRAAGPSGRVRLG